MLDRLAPCSQVPSPADIRQLRISFASGFEEALAGLVGYEEERSARGRADHGGTDAGVDTAEATGGIETAGGLQAGFQRVDRVEGEVDGGASEASCLVEMKMG